VRNHRQLWLGLVVDRLAAAFCAVHPGFLPPSDRASPGLVDLLQILIPCPRVPEFRNSGCPTYQAGP
jgi:hypothetical protein